MISKIFSSSLRTLSRSGREYLEAEKMWKNRHKHDDERVLKDWQAVIHIVKVVSLILVLSGGSLGCPWHKQVDEQYQDGGIGGCGAHLST